MADTTTTHYGWTQPQVGASINTWGTKLNNNLAALDSTLWSVAAGMSQGVNAVSSGSNITLTAPMVSIQRITTTAGSLKLIMPAMNGASAPQVGAVVRIDNVGSNAFQIVANDGTTNIVTTVAAGASTYLTVLSNATANGTWGTNALPSGTSLLVANNLSDVASASSSRTNLGLAALATLGVGAGLQSSGGNLVWDLTTEATIASATTTDLGTLTSNVCTITGTTAITSLGNTANANNPLYFVRFQGILTLTNGANLIIPGGANVTTAAGDCMIAKFEGTSKWRIIGYFPATGAALAGSGLKNMSVQVITSSGTYTPTAGMKFVIGIGVGGGAGAGGISGGNNFSSSGGSGAFAMILWTAAQIGASKSVTIGAAGAGSATTGTGGGTTSITSLCSLTGGSTGSSANSGVTQGGAGGSVTVSSGTLLWGFSQPGGDGGLQGGNPVGVPGIGPGGSTPLGAGGQFKYGGQGGNQDGYTATGYGAGGSGAMAVSGGTNTGTGGSGTAGAFIFLEFQ